MGSNSEFLRWQMSIDDANVLFCLLSLLQRSPLFLFLTFVSCQAGIISSFSHSLSAAAFASGVFINWGIGINLCTRLWRFNELIPFPAMWSSWSLCGVPSMRFLVDSSASTIHAYLCLANARGATDLPALSSLWSCKALLLVSELPTISAHCK